MLKTSGNVLILPLAGPPSSLSATNTSSSCLPKKSTIPVSYLQPPITPGAFGKQSINSYTANLPHSYRSLLLALHLQTALLLFFTGKISKLRLSLTSNTTTSSPHSPSPPATPPDFSVSPLPQNPKSTRPCPTVQTSNLTRIPYLPAFPQSPILSTGQFHSTLKKSIISPLLTKPTLDKEELSNYRPISNLSLVSKIIERVVKFSLTDHLTSNSLLNSH